MGVRQGDDPEKYPASRYLDGAIRFTDAEKQKYGGLWEEATPEVLFHNRNSME